MIPLLSLAPSAVSNLVVEDVNSTALMVSFSTPDSPNGIILRYNIRYTPVLNSIPSGVGEIIITVSPNDAGVYNKIISVGLAAFTMYRVRVAAVSSAGQGEVEERVVSTDPTGASPPTNFNSITVTPESITLTWGFPETPRGSIQGYVLRYHLTSDMETTQEENITILENDNSMQSFTFSGLLPFTSYTFAVRAYSFGSDPFVVHQGAETELLVRITAEAGRPH